MLDCCNCSASVNLITASGAEESWGGCGEARGVVVGDFTQAEPEFGFAAVASVASN